METKEESMDDEPITKYDGSRAFDYPISRPDFHCLSASVPPPPFIKRQVGRMYVLMERVDDDGVPVIQCVVGPCWPMIFVTLGLVLSISLGLFFGLFNRVEWYIKGPVLGLIVIVVIAYLCTACRNPGIQRLYEKKMGENWTYNDQAQSYRKPGAIYDIESQVIISQIDHFCPWIGTTVAEGNIMAFHVFLFSICLLLVALCTLVILAFLL